MKPRSIHTLRCLGSSVFRYIKARCFLLLQTYINECPCQQIAKGQQSKMLVLYIWPQKWANCTPAQKRAERAGEDPRTKENIDAMIEQTVECSLFIHEYLGRGFWSELVP